MRRPLLAVLAVVFLLAAWGLSQLGGSSDMTPLEVEPPVEEALVPGDTTLPEAARPDSTEERGTTTNADGRREVSSTPQGEPTEESATREVGFVAHLVGPDGKGLDVVATSAVFSDEDGELVASAHCEAGRVSFPKVTPGRYTLSVTCEDHTHRPEVVELANEEGARVWTRIDRSEPRPEVVLWPAGWLPVVVETSDGRPFRTLAEDLDWHPKRMFVGAFEVRVSRELALAGQLPSETGPELASWRPAPGYQNVELPGSVAGSVQLLAEPPLWAGLWVHGVPARATTIHAGDTELYFTIDQADLDAALATVRFRLVDKDTGAPVREAETTLKADTSAHRRKDLSNQPPGEDGQYVFERVVPGQHELTVLRGANLVQRRIALAPGQDLDLGDLPIGSEPGIPMRVVDASGQPVRAWVEIAPLERGRYVGDLFPPNLFRQTEDDGTYLLPVPETLSAVRVRPLWPRRSGRGSAEVGSANYRLDPGAPPAELVVLAVERLQVRVVSRTPWVAGQRLTLEDEHGLVVSVGGGESNGPPTFEAVPGDYRVRRFDGAAELGALDVTLREGVEEIPGP